VRTSTPSALPTGCQSVPASAGRHSTVSSVSTANSRPVMAVMPRNGVPSPKQDHSRRSPCAAVHSTPASSSANSLPSHAASDLVPTGQQPMSSQSATTSVTGRHSRRPADVAP
jgi:hypothetical protein